MEYPDDPKKAFGVITPRLPNSTHTRIKVLGIVGGTVELLSKDVCQRTFPPHGYVWAFQFFDDYSDMEEGDLIQFQCEQNERALSGWDIYRMIGKPKKMGSIIFPIKNFINNYTFIDLSKIEIELIDKKGSFYGLAGDKYIIGKLHIKSGQLFCSSGFVNIWDKSDCRYFIHDGKEYLLEHPNGESRPLDCLSEERLFEWFREKLRSVRPELVDLLDRTTSWRKDIPGLLQASAEQELDEIRMERLTKNFQSIKLTQSEIEQLMERSEHFKQAFQSSLETYKQEFLDKYNHDLQQLEEEKNRKEKRYTHELEKIQRNIKDKNTELAILQKQLTEAKNKLEHLDHHKDRLLVDFSIFADLLRPKELLSSTQFPEKEYVLEEVVPGPGVASISRDIIIDRLKYHFRLYQLDDRMASQTFDSILLHHALFISDITIALAFARAFGYTRYIIQQVGPDWLHFSYLWKNGLGEIWQSAHSNPHILHLLVLQDLNFSSPECYARPLLDVLSGIRAKIPFGQTSYPANLKILATKASVSKPKIGLPLLQQTFHGWGHVGFSAPMAKTAQEENYGHLIEGYGDAQTLEQLFPGKVEVAIILAENRTPASALFDESN
jgi:hypothetical protein